ncbi:serine/threonine protein kinase [Candidatus Woesearchaeota archaeon]|nr:serine/threonine protein kinase [Candidatus Woesearchaeota archaeon]
MGDELGGYKKRMERRKKIHYVGPGMSLQHYYIEDRIGEGRVANIFVAKDTTTGERVSIKAVRPETYIDRRRDELIERFRREAEILSEYHHPNLINLRYFGEDGRTLFYAFDYIDGRDLSELIRACKKQNKYFGQERAVSMAITIASVLEGLHKKGIFHRDLKSENIMVEDPDRFILIDLGYSKITEDDPHLTKLGDILGTAEFMPPEELSGKPFDARGDIYSLTTILYEALCNRTPFVLEGGNDSLINLVARKRDKKAPDIKIFNPNLDSKLNVVVMKGLEKDPEKRYQDCEEMITDLEEVQKRIAA